MRALKISFLVFILSISVSAQNFWHQTNGPYGNAAIYDFLQYDDSTIFLGTGEGIIRSLDNGETWSRISGQYLETQIKCLSQDKLGTLYAGSRNSYNGLLLLFKSTDKGDTWQHIGYGYSAEIRYIFIPYKDTIMLGTWDMGVIRTFDGGVSWSRVNNGNSYNSIHEIIQLDDGSVLAGSDGGGVFKTTNWGDLWIASNSGITPNPNGYIYAESFYETSPGNIFVGTGMGIYFSSDYGNNWIYKNNGLTNFRTAQCIEEDTAGILYAGIDLGNGVYYSTNGGDYWFHLGLNFTVNTLGWGSNSNLYAGGSGLYNYNFEDSTWFQVYNQSYTPVEVNDLCLTKSGYLIASTDWWGLHYSLNDGNLWKRTNYYGNEPKAIESINDSIFIAGDYSHVYVSSDFGKTWTITADLWVGSIYYEPTEEILYLGTFNSYTSITGLYTSLDFGQTWTLLYSFPQIVSEQMIIALRVTKTNKLILASLMYHYPPPTWEDFYHFYKSTDNGQTWETILEHESRYVSIIEEDVSSNIYAFAGDALLISNDEGNSWITREIPSSALFAQDYSGRIFRTSGNNIWFSSNQGIFWLSVDNSGLNGNINDIVITKNNKIYLATEDGVFWGEADSIVVSVEKNEPLKLFSLSQNYPNPFNPSTVISYQLPVIGFVSLKVYDILGKEIATLVNEEQPAGEYEIEFDGSALTSGIYFYQLKAGDFTQTKKMILLK